MILFISTSYYHTLFLSSDGRVYACGDNSYKELCLSEDVYNTPTLIPSINDIIYIACGHSCTFFIDINNRVYVCGTNTL
jgi:alpha-tubulin suppressor-like RCC1 family protein